MCNNILLGAAYIRYQPQYQAAIPLHKMRILNILMGAALLLNWGEKQIKFQPLQSCTPNYVTSIR
jgi:hypothetical protein